ncbi:hypothetical protein [Collimonas sp.]|jgi:hypothetical protein|uniref:hypothetical protein n=1 Tax=Collimonas sp. TaxID=1963772 RepID=UPI002B7366E1|nr:hypothetical protein [Collimonas sp.]HWW07232.1 hypothetical protein [Collimonas sp.]
MNTPIRQFKFSGMIAPQDPFHQITRAQPGAALADEHYIAPTTVNVTVIVPPGTGTIGVPQYAPTVIGEPAAAYDPAHDCRGNYMSYKFQPNNNCYAYGCNITPNTFPQPGRRSGYLLTAADFQQSFDALGTAVSGYAVRDGLTFVGKTMADIVAFKSARQGTSPATQSSAARAGYLGGHFVALMVSTAGDANWPGDYHWARCDNSSGPCDSWSQKDGGDQVTNFDFAGNPITDPSTANWTVNQGPSPQPPNQGQDQIVGYGFYCFMFVPDKNVNIV